MKHIYPFLVVSVFALILFACSDGSIHYSPNDGDAPDGDASDGDASDGDAPDGDLPDGDAPDGDLPDGDAPDGDLPDGDGTVVGDLLIVPGSLVFGELPRGFDMRLGIILRNIGEAELTVTGVTFINDAGGVFTFKTAPDLPLVLAPGEDDDIAVLATATDGTPLGETTGEIRIRWVAGDSQQQATVPLHATIVVPSPPCLAIEPLIQWEQDGQLLPPSPGYDFGWVSIEDKVWVDVRIANCGDRDLTIEKLKLTSPLYQVARQSIYVSADSLLDAVIARHDHRRIRVFFEPGLDKGLGSAILSFSTNAERYDWEPERVVAPPTRIQMPFSGVGVDSKLVSEPTELNFGSMKIGCCSEPQTLLVTQNGSQEAEFGGVETTGDILASYRYDGLPDVLPFTLDSGDQIAASVQFCPEGLGDFNGSLVFKSASSYMHDLDVPVTGRGVSILAQTDYFQMPDRPMVDLLFVVDCYESMAEEKRVLADGFADWIGRAAYDDIDLAVAITSTRPGNCCPLGDPPVMKNQGLGAMTAAEMSAAFALRLTNTTDQVTSANPYQGLAAAYKMCGYSPVPFIREDAKLVIVWASDKDDYSVDLPPLPFLIDTLRSVKGAQNEFLIDAYAIVGDAPDGCERSDSQGTVITSAEAGTRYSQVADGLNPGGDHFYSICEESYTPVFDRLVDVVFNMNSQFFLTHPADPTSMLVIVDDEVSTDYVFDEVSNSIIFNAGHEPDFGQLVTVSYEVICQ